MPNVSTDLVALLNLLLPGFATAWVFYGLTPFARPSPFERVVQALVFNLMIQPTVLLTRLLFEFVGGSWSHWPWTIRSDTSASILYAFALGLLLAGISNSDKLHKFLRERTFLLRKRCSNEDYTWIWTWEDSHPSVWHSALSRRAQYVVLHLSGGRRLYGWPDEWPSEPGTDYFVISEAEWLLDGKGIKVKRVEAILVPGKDVELIEFLEIKMKNDESREMVES